MRKLRVAALLALIAAPLAVSPLYAEGERAGAFDYYVMALSWSPTWCALEGDARNAPECRRGNGKDFTVHGLWPQSERGWPSYCRTTARDPSRAESAAMADILGAPGLAWYQWKKHGRCAGLSAADYFATVRKAAASVKVPAIFPKVDKSLKVPADVVEAAFLEANPQLSRDQVTISCKQGRIHEVKICLTRDLEPRRCGADVIRDCTLKDAVLDAVR